jgi:RHS repeat-associated protein
VTYQFTYTDDYNQIASITDPLNHTTTFSYNNGCLAQITDPLGHATTFLCNSAGQPTAIEDALGHLTTLSYQGYDLQSITDALGRTVTVTVDALGRPVASKDPLGNVALKLYDTNDRVVRVIDGLNQTTQIAYDGNGNPTQVTLPNGKAIVSTYDGRNRRISRTDPLGQVESWTFDGMNHPLSYTDRKQQTRLYTYDALDRRTLTTYADGSGTQATYDAGNRVTELLDTTTGSLSWGYDDLDRVTQAVTPQGTVGYSYDAANRRTGMTPASQAAVTYQYDNANRLLSITQGSEVVQLGYDEANRRTSLTLPNGIFVTYGYDNANQLTGLVYTQSNGTKLGDLTYSYDVAGQIIAQGGSLTSNQLPASTTQASTFDDNNRQTGFNGSTLSYDANGNLTSDGVNSFVWNARNQLVQIQQGGSPQLSFTYDALGRRISKTVGTTTPTQYLYDGDNAVQEAQGTAVNPILTGLGIDERYARNDVSGRTYFLTDLLGSTIGLANGAGEVKQRYAYDPYGNVTQTDTSTGYTNPYQYTGREADTASLYYYRARYYSPGMGRFIGEDPIGFGGGQLNFYAYVGGSPLIFRDPEGREFGLALIGVGIGGLYGLAQGLIAGHGGWELLADAGSGALAGGLAGLTNGMSLWIGVPLRAGIGAGAEAGRQMLVDGCLDPVGIGLAAGSSILGDATTGAVGRAMKGLYSEPAVKYAAGVAGQIYGGALPLPAAPASNQNP